jgi:PhzF family phenazine biosynthesis protein
MKTYFVDAFTNQPFKGNPAAVCIVEGHVPVAKMQNVATEIGFSETAFIKRTANNNYNIRFFTPKQEIPLCGHATLASSKVIFETTNVQEINFVNIDHVELKIAKSLGKIVMQFPVYDTEDIKVPKIILEAIGVEQIVNTRFSSKNKIILIEIKGSEQLALLKPDYIALVKSYDGINGILVTAKSDNDAYDFHYRYFWPWAGTNEDPVTGGAQTFLTKYWALKLDKNKLKSFQSSLRTGSMTTELLSDSVLIYGEAIIMFEGELKI